MVVPWCDVSPKSALIPWNTLQATIHHHGPSTYSGHYATSINCCKTFYCNDSKITEVEMIDTKKSSPLYVVTYEFIT